MSTLPLFTPHACRRHCRLPSPDIGAARCVARGPPRLLAAPSAASVGERPPPPSCGVPPTPPPPPPPPPPPSDAETLIARLQAVGANETALTNPYGTGASHAFVPLSADGIRGDRDRFVYVDEVDCIGCTHCASTARHTFFMEEEWGRARAFRQDGDDPETVAVAIDTCPVNCIYYVSYDDLVTLEQEREGQVINNKARLVGGDAAPEGPRGTSKSSVMRDGRIRCQDCPGRGCAECPLYGVGRNPEYVRKVKARKEQQAQRRNGTGDGDEGRSPSVSL
ncbi:hypothetical protein I4F81_009533 [Pyropia yezoensis]|uniref:Uncharacterized protein n=1 Tax=Pyropia yezoensis TaxID=2788 RepID=A0ACC3CAB8_PYRYE|nr:hypothetical protein I4F81_009533 [Neopyropia yezoensis]